MEKYNIMPTVPSYEEMHTTYTADEVKFLNYVRPLYKEGYSHGYSKGFMTGLFLGCLTSVTMFFSTFYASKK